VDAVTGLAARLGDAAASKIEHAMRVRRETHQSAIAARIKQSEAE
jgi:hypothetical protein